MLTQQLLDAESDIQKLQNIQEESNKKQEEMEGALQALKKENSTIRRELEENRNVLEYERKEGFSVEQDLRMELEKSQISSAEYLSTIHQRDAEVEQLKHQLEGANADQIRLKEDLQLV
jgi:predicted  nucleic acid-binding Zn-ribbon protein